MKKFISTLFLALLAVTSWAFDAYVKGIYYNLNSTDKTAEMTWGPIDYSDAVEIPESITYDGVTYAVTSIGENAFIYCPGLTSVTIPNSVTSIGKRAFAECTGLNSGNIYVEATTPPTCDGYEVFSARIYATVTLHVPKGTKALYFKADDWKGFNNIVEYSDIDIDGIYYILYSDEKTAEVASGYVKYTGNVVIPESVTYEGETYSVTSIGDMAFYDCKGLTSVAIGNSVVSIGNSAFYSCSSLTSVDIPNSVTSIGEYAFCSCSGLKSVTIPSSVTSIGESAFRYCGLESVTIPNSVTSIEKETFCCCKGLKYVTIPNSVTSIGEYAFSYCRGLKSIYLKTATPPTCGNYVFFNGYPWESDANHIYDTTVLHVVKGTKDLYFDADDWNQFNNIVEDSDIDIDGIYYNLYSDDKTAEVASNYVKYTGNVVIPESVTYEGETYSVTSIGDFAFYKCEGLTSVTIPNSVTSIGECAFEYCKGLTSVDIPNSVTSIGESAFCVCTGLKSVTIPNSVTRIEGYAFGYCKGLTSVTIPNSVTSIGNSAFYYCTGLTSVTIPNSVTRIEGYAFGYCPLESVTIPNSVTSIGNYAFCMCMHLKSLVIGNSVVSIGEGAFIHCDGLTSVTFPSSVTSIGYEAFYGCSGFTSIYVLADTPPYCYYSAFGSSTLGDYTFYDRVTLHVVKGTKDLYSKANEWMSFKNITDDLTSGIEEVSGTEVSGTRKFLHNGRVIIERNGKQFTTDGAEIK